MPNKPRNKPEIVLEKNTQEKFLSFLNGVFNGKPLKLNPDYCVVGRFDRSLKLHLTKTINVLINKHGNKRKRYKIGKTGNSPKRVEYDDYRLGVYSEMYLLYESTSIKNVENLERYYSAKFKPEKRCDNIDTDSRGKMVSINGKYYLYIML